MVDIVTVEQGTVEWRKLRAPLLTGSRVAQALGDSPWGNPKSLIKEMVLEMNGIYNDVDAPAMRWGRENEDIARIQVETLMLEDFSDQAFRKEGRFGYSPDGVSDHGEILLEIKCPYSKREDAVPQFESVHSLPHYYHQIQFGMWMTGARECYFFQWAPHGNKLELVSYDEAWVEKRIPKLLDFLEKLDEKLEDPEYLFHLTERKDEEWENATNRLRIAKEALDAAKDEFDARRNDLIELSGDNDCHGCGWSVSHIESAGRVSYPALVKGEGISDETLEKYRGKPTKSIRVTEKKS